MHRFFSFWWLCARTAFWGNASFANDWQWVFGNPIASTFGGVVVAALGAIAPTVAVRLGATEMTTGAPALDSFLGALAAFVITWFAEFVFRFSNAPVKLYHEQKDRVDTLEGIPPARPPSPDKNLAILKERYLSEKPTVERELLDIIVDGLQAMGDVTLIFNGIAASTERLTKTFPRHNRRISSAKDFEKNVKRSQA